MNKEKCTEIKEVNVHVVAIKLQHNLNECSKIISLQKLSVSIVNYTSEQSLSAVVTVKGLFSPEQSLCNTEQWDSLSLTTAHGTTSDKHC
jgi:hypothetical protein